MDINQNFDWAAAWLDWADTCSIDRCQEKHQSALKNLAQKKFSRFYAWYASKGYSSKLPNDICAFHELESHLYNHQAIKGKPFKSYLFEDIALRKGGLEKNITGYLLGSQSVMKDIVKRSVDVRIRRVDAQILDGRKGEEGNIESELKEEWMCVLLENRVTSEAFKGKDRFPEQPPETTSALDEPETADEATLDIDDAFATDEDDLPRLSVSMSPIGAATESAQKDTAHLDDAQKLVQALKAVWESLPDPTKVLFFCYLKGYPLYVPEVVKRTQAPRATASYRIGVLAKTFKQVGDEQLNHGYSQEDIYDMFPKCLKRIVLTWASKNQACRDIVKNVRQKYQQT